MLVPLERKRMELIDNKALKITVPNDIVDRIKTAITKTKVLDTREHLTDLLIHWVLKFL